MTTPHLPTPREARRLAHGYNTTVSIFEAEWHCTTGRRTTVGRMTTVCACVVRMPRRWYFVAAEERDG